MRHLALLLVAALAACEPPAPPGEALVGQSCQVSMLRPEGASAAIDFLFVVDESPAMAPYQPALAANLRRFGEAIESFPYGPFDVHIGFVSADPAHAGALRVVPGCGLREGAFVVDEWAATGFARTRNYDGSLGDVLACLGTLGAHGSATSAPLAAMRAALEPSNPANAGFLRPTRAVPYIAFLVAQDDCSGPSSPGDALACAHEGVTCTGGAPGAAGAYDGCVPASGPHVDAIDPYVDFLREVTSQTGVLGIAVASAPEAPFVVGDGPALASSCPGGTTMGALPTIRLAAFAHAFDGPSRPMALASICADDWSAVLRPDLFVPQVKTLGLSCFDAPVTDVRPDLPGVQPECAVREVRYPGTDRDDWSRVLPRCRMLDDRRPAPDDARPCWWLRENRDCDSWAPDGHGYTLEVQRTVPTASLPGGLYVEIECSCEPATP